MDNQDTVVAIGGGTGLPLVLRCLVGLGYRPNAVVTMADDGGSSGRLRREIGIVPPGDVRNCLIALADPREDTLADVFGYRFGQGEGIEGHALGNLILAALTDLTGSFKEAVKLMGRHLNISGRVLPSTYDDIELHGFDRDGIEIFGQASLAANAVAISQVQISPPNAAANPDAVQAILDAKTIIIGPGSLYTSIIPNLLVQGILDALHQSTARVVYLCNVANMRGETAGFDAYDHVQALCKHGLEGRIDTVVLPSEELCASTTLALESRIVVANPRIVLLLEEMGIKVVCASLADKRSPMRHSQSALTDVLRRVM